MPYFHMRVIKSVSLHSVNTAWLRLIFLQQLELRLGDFTKQTHLKYGDFMDTWSSQKTIRLDYSVFTSLFFLMCRAAENQ